MAAEPTNPTRTRERVRTYVERAGLSADRTTLDELAGDASNRQFIRVQPADGPTRVLVVYPEPIDPETLSLVNVGRLFERMSVPVPAILGAEADLGIVEVEDLGDVTLQDHLEQASARERITRYEEAVGLIAVIQREGRRLASPAYAPFGLAFDVAKLTWELGFFVDHFVMRHRGRSLAATERAALTEEFLALARELADEPRVLCHRDYHSRNLMVHAGQLYVIDFQDARMGPDTYDLVSLLRDSYVELERPLVDRLIDHYLTLAAPASPAAYRRRFDRMAVQRNLKALGTFGHQVAARGNTRYVDAIPRTLSYLRETFDRNPRFARLRDLLAAHLDELRA